MQPLRRHPRARALLAVLVALLVPRAPARAAQGEPPKRPVVAVLPLRALGATPEAARALETTLRNEVAALPEVELASAEALAAALKREPDCVAQIACAAAAAAKAGARQLITGTVSSLGDSYTLDLKLVDARSAQELRRATHPASGKEEQLIELLRATVVELLAPARYAGRLEVLLADGAERDARGARVFIDGKPRGTLPLEAPLSGLVPGQHTLRVAKEGFLDATLFVEVRFDRTTQARLDLEHGALAGVTFLREQGVANGARVEVVPAPPLLLSTGPRPPPKPREPWLKIGGWSAVGVGVVAAVTGLAFHAKAYSTASDLSRRSASNQLTLGDLAAYGDIDREVRTARVLYVAGGLVAAAGAGLLFWDHHLEQARVAVAAAPLPSGAALRVGGRF